MPRNRPRHELRPIAIQTGFLERTPASVLYCSGATKVLCVASITQGVPAFLEGTSRGWTTAEYDMLPGATTPRHARERSGKISGRTQEIQRLVGRSLRGIIDLNQLTGLTLQVDCDVLQADGGTRTASIDGAYVAVSIAVNEAIQKGLLKQSPILQALGAVSVGILDGEALLDLDYLEDSKAEVDLNVVLAESGSLLEVQGTSEGVGGLFTRSSLNEMLDMAAVGIAQILKLQQKAIEAATE